MFLSWLNLLLEALIPVIEVSSVNHRDNEALIIVDLLLFRWAPNMDGRQRLLTVDAVDAVLE